ncbi:MAG: T9SS type B sorting domain-containing protein [Bacteroidota bacterium]
MRTTKKNVFILILFLGIAHFAIAQSCPGLVNPVAGAVDVPVGTTITWSPSNNIPGYQIRLGTAPGLSDLGQASVGSATSYTPPLGLPENTEVFVTIVLDFLFQGGSDIVCSSLSFTTEDVTSRPPCTTMNNPQNGNTGVSIFTNISWLYAPTATGYRVSLGTTPGGTEIENNLDVGNILSYNPPGQLPPNTTIYVRIVPYNENGNAVSCTEFNFTTGDIAPLPGCTTLISPMNGSQNVPLTPFIEWQAVPDATGYRVTIGSTPDAADVLDNATFFTNSTFVIDFESNKTFFITIIPFNISGDAVGCGQEAFSTSLGCGPFLDPNTGELNDFFPDITFDGSFSFCEGPVPSQIEAPMGADGYRWFSVNEFGTETLLSEDRFFNLTATGSYILEAYNIVSQPSGEVIECPVVIPFTTVSSALATIDNLLINETALGLDVTVIASGIGDYEYAINDINGPYQDSNLFRAVAPGTNTFYVRDRNGCGIAERILEQDLTVEGFPKFFTPNGDTVNDFWQFIQPVEGETVVLTSIQIFDRYGKLLKTIQQNSQGWDGRLNGSPMPSGDYWFKAINDENQTFQGHFSLKR